MTQINAKDTDTVLIEFKGSTLPVLAITLRSLDPQALASAGSSLFGDGGFFDGDLAVLDLSQLTLSPSTIDWSVLIDLLSSHGLKVLGVTRCNSTLGESAQASGLPVLNLSGGRSVKAAAPPPSVATREERDVDKIPLSLRKAPPLATEPESLAATGAQPKEALLQNPASVIIDRPLRSGQQIYAKGSDLIILAAVNPGAEVIADGSIHIYAPLRGRALAGARGNQDARILTTSYGPELVSIAGIYKTYEDGIPDSMAGQPVQVRLTEEPGGTPHTGNYRLDVATLRID